MFKRLLILISLAVLAAFFVACSGDDDDATSTPSSAASTSQAAGTGTNAATATPNTEPVTLRLGFFPNITHAPPLVGLNNGIFDEELGDNVTVEQKTFNAGNQAIEALFAGEIDASYIGPNPAINGYVQSGGEALRIVSGATSGGALLVVRADAGISTPADLDGKKIASPALGNTQDVALRNYLEANGLAAQEQGGDVQVIVSANPDTLALMQQDQIDGAWVPEPWATRLVEEAEGEIFLDEKELWLDGKFVTTHLIVRTEFLEEHPDVVEQLVRANVKTIEWIADNEDEAKTLVNQAIEEITTAALPEAVINAAWENLEFTYDPIASSLFESATAAYELNFLDEEPNLDGIYELSYLNAVLDEEGLEPIAEP